MKATQKHSNPNPIKIDEDDEGEGKELSHKSFKLKLLQKMGRFREENKKNSTNIEHRANKGTGSKKQEKWARMKEKRKLEFIRKHDSPTKPESSSTPMCMNLPGYKAHFKTTNPSTAQSNRGRLLQQDEEDDSEDSSEDSSDKSQQKETQRKEEVQAKGGGKSTKKTRTRLSLRLQIPTSKSWAGHLTTTPRGSTGKFGPMGRVAGSSGQSQDLAELAKSSVDSGGNSNNKGRQFLNGRQHKQTPHKKGPAPLPLQRSQTARGDLPLKRRGSLSSQSSSKKKDHQEDGVDGGSEVRQSISSGGSEEQEASPKNGVDLVELMRLMHQNMEPGEGVFEEHQHNNASPWRELHSAPYNAKETFQSKEWERFFMKYNVSAIWEDEDEEGDEEEVVWLTQQATVKEALDTMSQRRVNALPICLSETKWEEKDSLGKPNAAAEPDARERALRHLRRWRTAELQREVEKKRCKQQGKTVLGWIDLRDLLTFAIFKFPQPPSIDVGIDEVRRQGIEFTQHKIRDLTNIYGMGNCNSSTLHQRYRLAANDHITDLFRLMRSEKRFWVIPVYNDKRLPESKRSLIRVMDPFVVLKWLHRVIKENRTKSRFVGQLANRKICDWSAFEDSILGKRLLYFETEEMINNIDHFRFSKKELRANGLLTSAKKPSCTQSTTHLDCRTSQLGMGRHNFDPDNHLFTISADRSVIDAFKIIYNYKVFALGVMETKGKEKNTDYEESSEDENDSNADRSSDASEEEDEEDSTEAGTRSGDESRGSISKGHSSDSLSWRSMRTFKPIVEEDLLQGIPGRSYSEPVPPSREKQRLSRAKRVEEAKLPAGKLISHLSPSDLKNFEPFAMMRCLHMSVKDYLSSFKEKKPLVTCRRDTTLIELLDEMRRVEVTRVWLMEDGQGGKPIGLITLHDIITEVASSRTMLASEERPTPH